ncbi:hypothetical protein CVS47_01685 [Microbacterium lemovicicum]|uniref:DUF4349 domain-containing protein n=1 Tax=Microbacterium lemovicicum TaxID=1072463 RepID=A0A3Q9J049_9MICO|nr:DUF4349 domain-containing protein [Microbacterium lemovicicum]AZS37060.1 hypothetical protein CVS47_01685 [Microbacterium lemovicicum]
MTTPTPPSAPGALPVLSDERVDAMEDALFADIAAERSTSQHRRARRGRVWWGAGAAAAVVVVAALIAPAVGGIVAPVREESAVAPASGFDSGSAGSDSAGSGSAGSVATDGVAPEAAAPDAARGSAGAESSAGLSGQSAVGQAGDATREIIASGSATVVVDDVRAALRQVSDAAVAAGGFVESSTLGRSGAAVPYEGGIADTTYAPTPTDGGWVTVRVPSDQLAGVMDRLADVGEVTESSTSRQDVTDQSIDLDARIDAAQASVDRLTALMAEAGSVGDLIAAESALSERQATLESLQQQLQYLDAQVDMSSLSVSVLPRTVAVAADPAGFGDGLAAGWNGLIAALNGLVVALGFLIPWVVVIAVIGLAVWGVVRLIRRRRTDSAGGPDLAGRAPAGEDASRSVGE